MYYVLTTQILQIIKTVFMDDIYEVQQMATDPIPITNPDHWNTYIYREKCWLLMREKNKEQIYCKFVINTFIYIQILNAKTKARSKKNVCINNIRQKEFK